LDDACARAQTALRSLSDVLSRPSRLEHAVFENMAEGVIMVDEHGEIALWNRAAQTILRMQPPGGDYQQWLARVSAFSPDEFTPLSAEGTPLGRALRGEVVNSEQVFVRHDDLPYGIWISVNARPLTSENGRFQGAVAVFRDVTDERATRLAVDRAQQDLRRVIESSPEGIAVVRDERWIFVNRAMARALGYDSPAALAGRPRSEIIHPEDWPRVERRNAELLARGVASDNTYEVRHRRANGDYALMEVSLTPLTEFEGAPAVLLMVRDVTERKQLEAQLRMSERLVSVGTLATGVAHEINSPLAAVLGHIEWLSSRLERVRHEVDSAAVRALIGPVREAREAGERVRQIVRDLKLFSHAEEELRGPVDLKRVLDSAARLGWHEIRHRARLVKDYRELPPAYGNEARLGQVFLNLLVNAAQAIAEGNADANEIRLAARAEGDGVVVEVSDTGAGIDPEVAPRIFEPFFTTKARDVGTGLGLSICQRIVSDCGGRIEVRSAPGVGSVFRVTLRAAQGRAVRPDARVEASSPERRGRVLVLDDDRAIGTTLRLILSEWHEVTALTDGREALRRLGRGERYDLILCDVMMPEMTAMEFYAALVGPLADVPPRIVFVTGGAFTAAAREFLDAVPNPRVDKPFDVPRLVALVNERVAGS
jgi:two-component system, cell cycle sensor histidine kinase and response regulator CckA